MDKSLVRIESTPIVARNELQERRRIPALSVEGCFDTRLLPTLLVRKVAGFRRDSVPTLQRTSALTIRVDLHINHQEVPGATYLDVHDPGRTSTLVGQVAQATVEQVDQTVRAAHAASLSWRLMPVEQRVVLLHKAATLLDQEADGVAELMALESGMLVPTCRLEVGTAAQIVRDNADMAQDFLASEVREDGLSWLTCGVAGSVHIDDFFVYASTGFEPVQLALNEFACVRC